MIPYALTLSLLIPFVLAIILYLLRQRLTRSIVPITLILLAIPTLIFFLLIPQATSPGGAIESFPWASIPSLSGSAFPNVSIQIGLLLDGINLPVVLITAVMSLLAILYSVKYQPDMPGKVSYYLNILLLFVGMEGVLLSTNLIEFYIFWEFMLLPSYFLVAIWGSKDRSYTTGMKYFLYSFVGSLPLLIGIAATYGLTQSFAITTYTGLSSQSTFIALTAVLILIGFAVKMAIVPLHTWLPDTYVDAPTPVTALISSVMGKTGAYALIRLVLYIFAPALLSFGWAFFLPFAAFGVLTMIYGGFMALASTELKRLLAYSSISQMGYIFYGIASFSVAGVTGAVFHMLNHAIGIGVLFFCAGNIALQAGTTELDKLRGIAWKMPITCVGLLIGALTLAGIPPLSGFFSEWNIFLGGFTFFNTGIGAVIAFLAVTTVFLTFSYYLWLLYRFFISSPSEGIATVKEAPLSLTLPILILSVSAVLLGFASGPILQVIAQPARQIQGLLGGL
jgi:NADH-quinone oxidoreductase subunit M